MSESDTPRVIHREPSVKSNFWNIAPPTISIFFFIVSMFFAILDYPSSNTWFRTGRAQIKISRWVPQSYSLTVRHRNNLKLWLEKIKPEMVQYIIP